MPKLRTFVALQCVWLLLAIGYNLVSIWRLEHGLSGLSVTDPYTAAYRLALYFLVMLLIRFAYYRTFSLINCLFMIVVAYSGVYIHLSYILEGDLSRHSSNLALGSAIAINTFGVIVGSLASYFSWRQVPG